MNSFSLNQDHGQRHTLASYRQEYLMQHPPSTHNNTKIIVTILLILGVFLSILLLRDIPSRIAYGNSGRIAITTLDNVRRPFFEIYGAEKLLLSDGYSTFAQQTLDEGIKHGADIVSTFKRVTQYDPDLLPVIEKLERLFTSWINTERALFKLLSKTQLSALTDADIARKNALLEQTSKAFFIAMAHLGKGEEPIHRDINRGSEAIGELIILSGLLLTLLLAAIYYLQWSRSKAQSELLYTLEHHSEQLGAEVEKRTQELREAQEELIVKQRLAAIGQLTATVSHELRNPLGSIRNALAVVQRLLDSDNPMMNSAMAIIDRGISRCDLIITELLDYTRLKQLQLEPTDIDSWLNHELDNYTHSPNIKLVRELNSKARVSFDRERFLRALLNVLNNACDALLPEAPNKPVCSPQLSVSTRIVDNKLDIKITDNGVGIDDELQAKIFEPLFSTKSFGVGLGMPVVEQVLQQHGGSVKLESKSSQGTSFHLLLPLEPMAQAS
jgi:signal transduction histidine kinase